MELWPLSEVGCPGCWPAIAIISAIEGAPLISCWLFACVYPAGTSKRAASSVCRDNSMTSLVIEKVALPSAPYIVVVSISG